MKQTVRFTLNGRSMELDVEPDRMLLWVLRSELSLTGTKYGCGEGLCGSCTVLVDGKAERSCQLPMNRVAGKKVVTIEGLASNGRLHPIQTAFVDHDALQCGFCTPGMIMSAHGLLLTNPDPSQQQILEHMEDNLCRCGAHRRIVTAIQTAAGEMQEEQS